MTQLKRESMNANVNLNNNIVIDLPDSCALRVVSRSLFVAGLVFTLPFVWSILKETSVSNVDEFEFGSGSGPISFELVEILFRDLAGEGLLKEGDKVLVVSSETADLGGRLHLLNHNEIVLVKECDIVTQSVVLGGKFDLVLLSGSLDRKIVDRVLKIGGIMTIQLHGDHLSIFKEPSSYKVVYLRRFESTIVAMRKTLALKNVETAVTSGKLHTSAANAKRAALKGLERPLLEPPRKTLLKSTPYLKKIKYLPNLLDDSLKGYKRRVFITVGLPEDNTKTVQWFYGNYPLRNQHFEVFNIKTPTTSRVKAANWLLENVEEEEYVVMKAEAGVVEEMMKKKAISLVDELFLECKNQWGYEKKKKNKRAYWECLSLYGRLKDEGVAVHQWWG